MQDSGKSAIREIKSRLDIVELVRKYVQLRPAGGRFMGPCPFHQETKPSFSVTPASGQGDGFFYCFGCQERGDAIDFYSKINGLEFKEALERLAQETGVDMGKFGGISETPQEKAQRAFKKLYLDMYEWAQRRFVMNRGNPEGEQCRRYIAGRKLDEEIVKAFGLGFAKPGWDDLRGFLKSRGYDEAKAAEAGLLSRNDKGNIYDRFRNRLMFPIKNIAGQVIAFGGRVIDPEDEPKYINTSDTAVYTKGDHLYGLDVARRAIIQARRALLTEGYMDVIALHQHGYANSCGVLGTALTPNQVKRLSGFCAQVDLVFDGDDAGRKAALRSAEMLLAQGMGCRVVLLPQGEDIDSLLQGQGKEVFDDIRDKAATGLDFCLSQVEGLPPKEVLGWAKTFLGSLANQGLRAYFLPRLAQGLGMDENALRSSAGLPDESKVIDLDRRRGKAGKQEDMPSLDQSRIRAQDVIEFAVQYPQHMELLEANGALFFLGELRGLWNAIKEHSPEEAVTMANDSERQVLIGHLAKLADLRDLADREVDDYVEMVHLFAVQQQSREIIAEYKKRVAAGQDVDELEFLLQFSGLLGRTNGQH
ncbi:MAG: DNA primase [Desulfovibrio sp.]|nr:MAG: DNA primase [Desulfovibrio sp.]